ncbi:spermidine synthase, partial [Pseudomonadota bacterium]
MKFRAPRLLTALLKLKLLFTLLIAIPASGYAEQKKPTAQCPAGTSHVIQFQKNSIFGDIFVVDSNAKRHLRFGNACGADQSSIDLDEPDRIIMEYVRNAALSLAYAKHRKSVLIVGMGGGVFSNMLAKQLPDIEIDAIEIDPVVVEVAKTFFKTTATPRYRIHIQDAAEYISKTDKHYDIILLDAYGSDGIPEHLATKSFFKQVASRLNPDGVVVANFGLDSPRVYLQLAERLRTSVGEARCLHGEEESNLVVIAAGANVINKTDPITTKFDSSSPCKHRASP